MENHIRKNRRIIVGISGASGVILGYEMLKALREQDSTEIHLIVTEGAKRSLSLESKMTVDSLFSLADAVYHETEMEAPVASGSFHTDGMIVIPCSMKTLSAIGKILPHFGMQSQRFVPWTGKPNIM